MKKNILTIVYILSFILIVYLLQLYVINPRELFGVKPNLILILVIVISLWYGLYVGGISSLILGIFTDIVFGSNIGIFTISYTIVGCLIGLLNSNYRKESKMSLVYVSIIATFAFEIVQCICTIVVYSADINILYLIKQSIISSLLNIVIVYIVYSVIYTISEYIEDRLIQNTRGL